MKEDASEDGPSRIVGDEIVDLLLDFVEAARKLPSMYRWIK